MITRKQKVASTAAIWPYTPEPSPPLGPTSINSTIDDHFRMPDDSTQLSRPISVASRRDGAMSPGGRPTLDDVLNSRAPAPYTLAAFTAFLSQQHCLETLEFVTEAKKYGNKYYEAIASNAGMPFNTDMAEGMELAEDWGRLLDIYVKPGAPREINLPAEERDDLIDLPYDPRPPNPEALEPAVRRMYDLMSDSIFIPFCNSMKASSAMSSSAGYSSLDDITSSRPFHQQHSSRRKRSPPTTSHMNQQPQQRPNPSSGLYRSSSHRLSTHISHSSAASETGMSDESDSAYSPAAGERDMFSPPHTPPQSDMHYGHGSSCQSGINTGSGYRPTRTESGGGGWKKLGNKLFGGGKKRSSER